MDRQIVIEDKDVNMSAKDGRGKKRETQRFVIIIFYTYQRKRSGGESNFKIICFFWS